MKKLYIITLLSLLLAVNQTNAQWTNLNVPISNFETYSKLAVSDDGKNLFSVMSDILQKPYFMSSHDYGVTWQQYELKAGSSSPTSNEAIFWEGDVLYFTDFALGVYKSTDFGATFSTQGSQYVSSYFILRTNDGKWYQRRVGTDYVSTDKGLSWNTVSENFEWTAYITATNGNTVALIRNESFGPKHDGGICYSDDNGVTWKLSILPAGTIQQYTPYTSISKATDGTLYAFLYSAPSILLKSTDNGVNWQKVNATLPENVKVVCSYGNDIFTYSPSGKTYKSTDGGLSFSALSSPPKILVISSMISNNNNVYLYGMSGIYKYGNSTTGIAESLTNNQLSAYPNPCQNFIHIESTENYTSYILTDLVGRSVKQGTITNPNIDLNSIHSGIYILTATGKEGKKSSIKIIKE